MVHEYPIDADGDALRRVASGGNDMSMPMDIDFHVAARDEATAHRVAHAAATVGYRTSVYCFADEIDDEQGRTHPWTCECTKNLVPTYEAVVAAQSELDSIARPFGGYSDGWGTLGNAEQ